MSVKEKKKRLRQIVAQLKREYGACKRPEERNSTNLLIKAILEQGVTEKAVEAAFKGLVTCMVDLNEVRVATTGDMKRCFGKLDNAENKGGLIKRVLDQIFTDKTEISADFLGKMSPEEAEKYLLAIPGMPRSVARRFLLDAFEFPLIPDDETTRRVWTRLGLIAEGLAEEQVCAEIDAICPKKEAYETYHLLRQHANGVCGPGKPKSDRCSVRKLCETGKGPKKSSG